jgi:hypothetical protein
VPFLKVGQSGDVVEGRESLRLEVLRVSTVSEGIISAFREDRTVRSLPVQAGDRLNEDGTVIGIQCFLKERKNNMQIDANPANPVEYLASLGIFAIVSRLDPLVEGRWPVEGGFELKSTLSETKTVSPIRPVLTEEDRWKFDREDSLPGKIYRALRFRSLGVQKRLGRWIFPGQPRCRTTGESVRAEGKC